MLMIEKGSLTKDRTNEELDEHTVPLNELLVNSTVPAAAVALKVCDDSVDEAGRGNIEGQKRGILSNFQRRTFSRISFKGESGPLLSSTFVGILHEIYCLLNDHHDCIGWSEYDKPNFRQKNQSSAMKITFGWTALSINKIVEFKKKDSYLSSFNCYSRCCIEPSG